MQSSMSHGERERERWRESERRKSYKSSKLNLLSLKLTVIVQVCTWATVIRITMAVYEDFNLHVDPRKTR